MLEFEYAIFDMDGTLVDSMRQWKGAGRIFLNSVGIEPTKQLLHLIRTASYKEVSETLNKQYGTSFTGVELEQEFFNIMRYSYRNNVFVKNGVFDFLRYLKNMEIPMCVATGTCQELTQYILSKLGLCNYFEFVVTCPEVGEDKHSPLVFEEALTRIGGEKENTLIFEDSLTAIKTASKVGFRIIGVYDETFIQDKRQISAIAEKYVYRLSELVAKEHIG
ncbi:MAG: HAD family phosphatase [bacterium]|nr:HAD family phosphatase [bacterium]